MHWPDLTNVLDGLPWAVAGGVATRQYMPERETADLDVAVRAEDAPRAESALRDHGFTSEGRLSIGGSKWRSSSGVALDLIEGGEPWWDEAPREAAGQNDQDGNRVLTRPFLVLMKLR